MAKQFKPETLCVQAGWTPKKGEPRVLPIYQSTTFKYDTSEQMARLFDLEDSGYFYTRLQNPTNDAVAAKIAALEGSSTLSIRHTSFLETSSRKPASRCSTKSHKSCANPACKIQRMTPLPPKSPLLKVV